MAEKSSVFRFIWKIENFSMLPHQKNEKLVSPKFVIDKWEDVDFFLRLYPKGMDVEGHIAIYLSKRPKYLDLKHNSKFTLESTELSKEISMPLDGKSRTLQASWGFKRFVRFDYIYDNKHLYLPQDILTVRCDVSLEDETEELSANAELKSSPELLKKYCVARTCIQVHLRSITWPICNIKEHIEQRERLSTILKSNLRTYPSLKLTLMFDEMSRENGFGFSITQMSLSSYFERLFAKCKITVISADRKYQDFYECSHLFELNLNDVWHFPSFVTASMLTLEKYLYVDNTLFLRCEFSFSYRDKVFDLENNYAPFAFESRKKVKIDELGSCIEKVYSNGRFCDVELLADGERIPYYKLLLCARSPVFASMFETDMRERKTNIVEIPDVAPDILKLLLEYMHSNVLEEDLTFEDICKLHKAADKYGVESLKRQCSLQLATSLSVATVCEVLTVADTYQDDFLIIAVQDFICSQKNAIFHSAQWKNFVDGNPKLAADTMHQMLMGKFRL